VGHRQPSDLGTAPSLIEVKMEEEGLEDLEDSNSSDISDRISIVYDSWWFR